VGLIGQFQLTPATTYCGTEALNQMRQACFVPKINFLNNNEFIILRCELQRLNASDYRNSGLTDRT